MIEFFRPLLALFNPSLRLQHRQETLARDLHRLDMDLERVIESILTEKVRFLEKLDAMDGGAKGGTKGGAKGAPAATKAEAPRKQVARPGQRATQRTSAKAAPSPEEVAAAKAKRAKTAALEAQCHKAFADLAESASHHKTEVDQLNARLAAARAPDLADELPRHLDEIAQELATQKSAISDLRLKAIATTTELHQACTKGAAPAVSAAAPVRQAA